MLSVNTHILLCSLEMLRLDLGAPPVIPGSGGQSGLNLPGLQGEALDSFLMAPRPHTPPKNIFH